MIDEYISNNPGKCLYERPIGAESIDKHQRRLACIEELTLRSRQPKDVVVGLLFSLEGLGYRIQTQDGVEFFGRDISEIEAERAKAAEVRKNLIERGALVSP